MKGRSQSSSTPKKHSRPSDPTPGKTGRAWTCAEVLPKLEAIFRRAGADNKWRIRSGAAQTRARNRPRPAVGKPVVGLRSSRRENSGIAGRRAAKGYGKRNGSLSAGIRFPGRRGYCLLLFVRRQACVEESTGLEPTPRVVHQQGGIFPGRVFELPGQAIAGWKSLQSY
jgi:hypothetical protein